MESTSISEKDIYKTSRTLYVIEAALEYFIAVTASGAYLAKLTTSIGISDSMTAILTSITSLAGIFQLLSIFLAHKTPVKRWVIPTQMLAHLSFAFLYMIPLLNFGAASTTIFFIAMLLARATRSIVSPAKSNWFISLVDDKKRGQFQALLTIVSLAGYIGFTFILSAIIDRFESENNLKGAFLTLTIIIFVLTLLHMLSLLFSKEKAVVVDKTESPFKSIRKLFENQKYRHVLIMYVLWSLAANIAAPFLGTYQIKELGFSMTFIAVIDVVLTVLHIPMVYYFGRYSMRHSYSAIMKLSYIFAFVAHIVLAITTKENGMIVYTLYRVINLITGAAQGVSSTNLIFDIVPQTERTCALSVNTIVVGTVGFLTTLAVSPFVDYVQANGNTVFGINMFAQQALAVIAALIILILIIYYFTLCKKTLEQ